MVVHIFFSLFGSPTKAFGSVSGEFEIESPVEKGQHVLLLSPQEDDWFDGFLEVETVTRDQDKLLVGLQDIVARSLDDASRLGKRFEAEAGLFCDMYD